MNAIAIVVTVFLLLVFAAILSRIDAWLGRIATALEDIADDIHGEEDEE